MTGSLRHPVGSDGLFETLDFPLPERLVAKRQSSRYGLVGRPLNADPARLRELLQPLSQHYPGAGDGMIGDDDLAHADSDPENRPDGAIERGVALHILPLEGERCRYRVRGPLEFHHQRITAQLVGQSSVRSRSIRKSAKRISYALVGECFIFLDEIRRADHVGVKHNGQFAASTLRHRFPPNDYAFWRNDIVRLGRGRTNATNPGGFGRNDQPSADSAATHVSSQSRHYGRHSVERAVDDPSPLLGYSRSRAASAFAQN